MYTVSALEAKTRLGELLDRVAQGEQIIITRYDKPVARIVAEGGQNLGTARVGVIALREIQQQIQKRTKGKAPLSDEEVVDAINEGRSIT